MDIRNPCLRPKMLLSPLISKGITISNFPEIYNKMTPEGRNRIHRGIKAYKEKRKWLDGRAYFPLKIFVKSIGFNVALSSLKNARFGSKGVCSDVKVKLPWEMTKDLAYFLGILAGDGYISKPKGYQRGGWTIQMCEDELRYQQDVYMPIVERLFGCVPLLRMDNRKDGRSNLYSRMNSFIAVQYLTKSLGIPDGYKADRIAIPRFIYIRSENSMKIAFLRGVFDTDGTVTDRTVKVSTVSKRMWFQLKKILEDNGIGCTTNNWLKKGNCKMLYTIRIARSSLKDFRKIIGFKNFRKKVKLDKALASPVV